MTHNSFHLASFRGLCDFVFSCGNWPRVYGGLAGRQPPLPLFSCQQHNGITSPSQLSPFVPSFILHRSPTTQLPSVYGGSAGRPPNTERRPAHPPPFSYINAATPHRRRRHHQTITTCSFLHPSTTTSLTLVYPTSQIPPAPLSRQTPPKIPRTEAEIGIKRTNFKTSPLPPQRRSFSPGGSIGKIRSIPGAQKNCLILGRAGSRSRLTA